MTAVTVVCDEKSMVDKAREWGHSLLPHKAGSNDVGCSSGPPAPNQISVVLHGKVLSQWISRPRNARDTIDGAGFASPISGGME